MGLAQDIWDTTENKTAPQGQLWVCCACGKTSKDRYGYQKINQGWDESCMLNAECFPIDKLVYNDENTIVLRILD